MFDPRPLCCSSLTTAIGGTKDTNIIDSESPYRGTNQQQQDQVDQHLFDPEPERTLHRIRKEQRTEHIRIQANMENNEEQDLSIEQNEP